MEDKLQIIQEITDLFHMSEAVKSMPESEKSLLFSRIRLEMSMEELLELHKVLREEMSFYEENYKMIEMKSTQAFSDCSSTVQHVKQADVVVQGTAQAQQDNQDADILIQSLNV